MSRQAGELWVRKPTETLQYHIDGETKTVFPEPHALVLDEGITDGDLVSLAYESGDTGAIRTDNSDVKRAYGFARITHRDPELDLPGEGELVKGESVIEIQTYGNVELPFSKFTFDPTHNDVGKGIYAVTPEEYSYRRETDPEPGKLTLSRTQATTFGGSIIEVGVIGFVDTDAEIVHAKVVIGGDSLGPVGLTEVEYTSNQLIPTHNTPRIFAYINNENPKNHREVFEWNIDPSLALDSLNDSWIAMDMFFAHPDDRSSSQKKTLVIYFTTETTTSARDDIRDDILNNGLTDSSDGSLRHTVPSVNAEGRFQVADEESIAFVEIPGTGSRSTLFQNFIQALDDTFASLFDYDGTFDPRLKVTVTNDVLEKGDKIATGEDEDKSMSVDEDLTIIFETKNSSISGAEQGGIIYLYRNPYLRNEDPGIEMKHYITQYGQLETGQDTYRVVPADRRRHIDGQSSNADKLVALAGALTSPLPQTGAQDTSVFRGASVMMQKMGIIDGFENLRVGKKVYLGLNGHVTQRPQDILYDEYLVELGVAKSESQIDLRLGTPQVKATTRDTLPVGVIVPRAYDLSKDPPEPAEPPPGFVALEGQTLASEEYPDLYNALTGEYPGEDSPALVLHDDPSHIIKAYSFNLFPDSATAELPVQARRYETPWAIIDGSSISADGDTINIPHNLKASIRDTLGYVVISATDASGGPGDLGTPMADAPQIIIYPGFGSDEGDFFGFQFQEDTMDNFTAKVGSNGLRVAKDDDLISVTSSNVTQLLSEAQNFTAKFVVYKIENIYDFKDDRLIKKANDFWYDHRRRYYSDDDVEVHGVRATTVADDGTLIRRDSDSRAQVSFPWEFTSGDYTDDGISSSAAGDDITNKEYVNAVDEANRNWTDGNLQTHKDTEDEGIHGSSYEDEANKLVHRNSDGQAQFADPSHELDATNKGYVDNTRDDLQSNLDSVESDLQSNIDTLDNYVKQDLENDKVDVHIADEDEGVHGSTVDATSNRLIHRDGNGRAKIETPSDSLDIANKQYVDDQITTSESRVRLPLSRPSNAEDGDMWLDV